MNEKTFEVWHAELTELAKRYKLGWLIPPLEDYPTDGYDDGLTPAEELDEQCWAAAN